MYNFNLNVRLGSLSGSTRVSTSVSTCISDSESVVFVSNHNLRLFFLI